MRTIAPLAACVAIAACGRVGFDVPAPDGGDAHRDAAHDALIELDAASGLAPIHRYQLDGDLTDDLGGPPAEVIGGGAFVADGYQFAANQGLRLAGVIPSSVYSIELTFTPMSVIGYSKLVDFKQLTSDAGLYIADGKLQFVVNPANGCGPAGDCWASPLPIFAAGELTTLVLTRDVHGVVTARVDDQPQWLFLDDSHAAVFDVAGNMFVDDTVTTGEAQPGIVREIRVFAAAL